MDVWEEGVSEWVFGSFWLTLWLKCCWTLSHRSWCTPGPEVAHPPAPCWWTPPLFPGTCRRATWWYHHQCCHFPTGATACRKRVGMVKQSKHLTSVYTVYNHNFAAGWLHECNFLLTFLSVDGDMIWPLRWRSLVRTEAPPNRCTSVVQVHLMKSDRKRNKQLLTTRYKYKEFSKCAKYCLWKLNNFNILQVCSNIRTMNNRLFFSHSDLNCIN